MRCLATVFAATVFSSLAAAQGVADEVKIKPDAKALQARFKVTKERFDPDKRRYVWVLEAKVTSEKPCQYDAEFQDPDDKEVTSVQVEFEDGGKQTEMGKTYRATVKYPTRKTMEKVTQVVVKQGG